MRKYKDTLVQNLKEGSMIVKNHGFAYKVEKIHEITQNVKLIVLSDSYGNTIEEYATIDRKYQVREDYLDEVLDTKDKVDRYLSARGKRDQSDTLDHIRGKTSPEDYRRRMRNSTRGKFAAGRRRHELTTEDWQKVNRQDKTDGLSQKAVDAYRRENPGSKLKTAVTEKNPKGKRAKRRASFCRRMSGMKRRLTSAKTARDPDSRINKALRRWRCNSSFEPEHGTYLGEEATLKSLAKKHGVSEEQLEKQLQMGMKVEKEHTDSPKEARKIALDHLKEKPNYYTLLKKHVEGPMKEEMDPTKHVRKNKDTGMFCVYNKDGKKVKEFKTKAEADSYAKKNHDDLMEKKDHEKQMIRSQLSTIMNAAQRLKKKMKGEGNVEAWVQSKLTKAADYVDAAADYIDSGEGDNLEEGKIYDRLIQQLLDRGVDKDRAHAIATAQLQKSGVFKKGTRTLTAKGKKRQAMGAAGRAKDRAAKRSGRKPSDYNYNPRTNGATLKNSYEPEGEMLEEGENKPTNPSAWADCIRQAKAKFKVYPSAYANGWAAKCYKKKGGGWKKAK